MGISAMVALVSGCGLFPRTHPEKYDYPDNTHTIQALCDTTRQFFATRAGTDNLKTSVGVGGKALSDKIGSGNGCVFEKNDGSTPPSSLGYVSLFGVSFGGSTATEPPSTATNYPTKVLTVDGVQVKAATEPPPKGGDPATTPLDVELVATIDGWKGELHFRATEDQTSRDDRLIQTGARALVDMIRVLKV
ncbi:hypothetical protein ACFYO1_13000 [Nocardia sp. NPDC006044]|uniref:hypothetical protein n=1 Tax=Nocardia sp. NPDC006044 TaxID=3364306 RepID=UPI003693D5AB